MGFQNSMYVRTEGNPTRLTHDVINANLRIFPSVLTIYLVSTTSLSNVL